MKVWVLMIHVWPEANGEIDIEVWRNEDDAKDRHEYLNSTVGMRTYPCSRAILIETTTED